MFGFVRTIRFRLTLWFVGAMALAISVLSLLVYVGLQNLLLENVDTDLRAAAARSVMPSPNSPDSSGDVPEESNDERIRRLILINTYPARLVALDGAILQTDPLFPHGITLTAEVLNTVSGGQSRYETIHTSLGSYRLYSAPVRINDTRAAAVQVMESLDEQFKTLADLRTLLLILTPLALLVAAIGGYFLAGRALGAMQHVRRQVEGIIHRTDLSLRVSRGLPDDEIGRLARTFDELLERVQQAMERERQFTADASHELRTPLTVLKGEISVALSRPRNVEEYEEVLGKLENSVDDISRLVEDLLTLARAASIKQSLLKEPIDLADLVTQMCERLLFIAEAKEIQLAAPATPAPAQTPASSVLILGDRIKLQRVFTNLIDNALRYTLAGGKVDVSVRQEGPWARVDVRDTGPGIASEHLPLVFDRFYRVDSGRAREAGGSGLGLSIVKAIVDSHDGRVLVSSAVGQGTCFSVLLPTVANGSAPILGPKGPSLTDQRRSDQAAAVDGAPSDPRQRTAA